MCSAGELKTELDQAQAMLGEAFEELKKVEMLDERDHARERAEANAASRPNSTASGRCASTPAARA